MKTKAIFFIIIIAIFDCLLFMITLMYSKFLLNAIVVHMIFYLVISYLDEKYLDEYDGIPNYLALFLPGLGDIIVAILYFNLYYFLKDSLILDDYERYIFYQSLLDKKTKIDYEKEMKTLSFLDQMDLLDSESKKQIIIDSTIEDYDNKVKLLLKGILDEDNEVKHYSAVSLNMIENEFSYKIGTLRESYNRDKNISTLLKLAETYKDYIESGLLSNDILQVFNYEYIDVLKKLIEVKNETFEILIELIKAYIRGDQLQRAEEANALLAELYPGRFEHEFYKLHIAYNMRDMNKLNRLLSELMTSDIQIPKEYENIIAFWTRKEGII